MNNLLSLTLAAKSEINVNKSITRAVSHMISSSVADDNGDDIYIWADIICSNRIPIWHATHNNLWQQWSMFCFVNTSFLILFRSFSL